MYNLHTYVEQSLKMYKLSNSDETSWITVCPERGGIITEFFTNGRHQFYLNKETLFDQSKKIRGGNPILFPISGQLKDGSYEWDGASYQMRNHGFARNHPWDVTDITLQEDQGSIAIFFSSNEETKKVFPFEFTVEYTYTLKGNELIIDQTFINNSQSPMPFYAGLHPYFLTKKEKFTLQSDASNYLDLRDETVHPFTGEFNKNDLTGSLVLLDVKTPCCAFQLNPEEQIFMETGQEFKYIMLWTEEGKDFVCVEPWMALDDELNRKKELVMIEPHSKLQTFMRLKVESL